MNESAQRGSYQEKLKDLNPLALEGEHRENGGIGALRLQEPHDRNSCKTVA
jgi:hypothetical protein